MIKSINLKKINQTSSGEKVVNPFDGKDIYNLFTNRGVVDIRNDLKLLKSNGISFPNEATRRALAKEFGASDAQIGTIEHALNNFKSAYTYYTRHQSKQKKGEKSYVINNRIELLDEKEVHKITDVNTWITIETMLSSIIENDQEFHTQPIKGILSNKNIPVVGTPNEDFFGI